MKRHPLFSSRRHSVNGKGIRLVNVFDLMEAGKFERHQNCDFLKGTDTSSIVLMVSHRWEDEQDPDPERVQFHGVIRFIIQACMMAMGSTPNVFNSVDFSEVILCPALYGKLAALYVEYRDAVLAGVDLLKQDRLLFPRVQQLLGYLHQVIGPQNAMLVAIDLAPLAYMMSHFDIWYDFTSLPQEPFQTRKEKRDFKYGLSQLNQYFSEHYAVITWSRTSLKRGWCFLEAMVSLASQKYCIFSSENSLPSSAEPAHIREPFFTINSVERLYTRTQERVDLTNDLTKVLAPMIMDAYSELRRKTKSEILSYLKAHNFKCTNGSDIAIVAGKLEEHLK